MNRVFLLVGVDGIHRQEIQLAPYSHLVSCLLDLDMGGAKDGSTYSMGPATTS